MNRPEQIFLLDPSSSGKNKTLNCVNNSHSPDVETSSLCRICASNTTLVLPIFEKEGLENNLADKIHKYLPIQVSQDDVLPTVVCFQCTTTILGWHELVSTCQQADTTLRRQLLIGAVNNDSEDRYSDDMSDTTVPFIETVKETIFGIFKNVTAEEDCDIEFICVGCSNKRYRYIEDLSDHLASAHVPDTSTRETIETFMLDHIQFNKTLGSKDNDDAYKPRNARPEKEYSCKLCESRFTSTSRLLAHLHAHAALDFEAGVACCGRLYSQRRPLALHLREHRAPPAPAACRRCGHRAPSAAALAAHVARRHAAAPAASADPAAPRAPGLKRLPAACPHCGKTFSNKYNMATHARSHSAPAPAGHACAACGRRYSTRGNLAAHVRAAHRAPTRACAACGETFARGADLRRHAARHGPATLRCALCPAAFHHADSLRRHRLAHEDARPHACRCGRAFRQRSHLAAHRAGHACPLLQGR